MIIFLNNQKILSYHYTIKLELICSQIKSLNFLCVDWRESNKKHTIEINWSLDTVIKVFSLWSIPSMIIGNLFSSALSEWVLIFVVYRENQISAHRKLQIFLDLGEVYLDALRSILITIKLSFTC